ncbi:hypothetical protein PIROE2DRAFT_15945 [Piromyces sp. E2]|nr:hypothetical protein PIROE2DRAFT_15945 [Piromyces sp. E2]|eukprot:OUM58707.1 hypothetical protein PIROE2DRAFT_15945 [Piromyces sp. E2]
MKIIKYLNVLNNQLICSVTKWLIDNEERLLKPPKEVNSNTSSTEKIEQKENKKHIIPLWALQHFEEKEKQVNS